MAKHPRLRKPAREALPGQRVSLGLKVGWDIKNRLDAVAKQRGTTQSQEAERRIEQTFSAENRIDHDLDFSFGRAMAGVTLALNYLLPVVAYHSIRENGGGTVSAALHSLPLANWPPNIPAIGETAAAASLFLRALGPGDNPNELADQGIAATTVRRLLTAITTPEMIENDPYLLEVAAQVRERLTTEVLQRVDLRLQDLPTGGIDATQETLQSQT
jgi:hypothetical protein